ncbi:unnamed protein product [Closterium sp. Yama58-4]|nr:unnamed protein product [Closterium sp. Yama58-4]
MFPVSCSIGSALSAASCASGSSRTSWSCVCTLTESFTLPASPQHNGIFYRRIGLIMEVAGASMIHAAAPHFLWPFAVRYAAHQLNLWPRVSVPETLPPLRWTGEVGDASAFRVGGSMALVCDTTADKLFSHHSLPEGGDAAADDTAATRHSPRLETPPGFPPRPSLPPLQPIDVDSGAGRGGDTGGADSSLVLLLEVLGVDSSGGLVGMRLSRHITFASGLFGGSALVVKSEVLEVLEALGQEALELEVQEVVEALEALVLEVLVLEVLELWVLVLAVLVLEALVLAVLVLEALELKSWRFGGAGGVGTGGAGAEGGLGAGATRVAGAGGTGAVGTGAVGTNAGGARGAGVGGT